MATQYATTAEIEFWLLEYRTALPSSWVSADAAAKTNAAINATDWMDFTWGAEWKGNRATSTQTRDWPRTGVIDNDGFAVSSLTIPDAIKRVCAEAAVLFINDELDSLPARVDSAARIRSTSISADSVSDATVYAGAGISESAAANVTFPKLIAILRHLIESSSTVDHSFV